MNSGETVTLSLRGGRLVKMDSEEEVHDNNNTNNTNNNNKKKKTKAEKRYAAWERYIQDESLEENWQRLLHDLDLGDFKSKTQCKKALKNVWVNIRDFLDAVQARDAAASKIQDEDGRKIALTKPVQVQRFPNQGKLAKYTIEKKRVFPRKFITDGSPLKLLLAKILH